MRLKTTLDGANPKLVTNGGLPSVNDASTTVIKVGGTNAIPASATGILGILTNVDCDAGSNLRFWTGLTTPNSNNLNVPGLSLNIPGSGGLALNLSTSFTAALDASGQLNLGWSSATGRTCGFAVDVAAYLS